METLMFPEGVVQELMRRFSSSQPFELHDIEALQISIGPGIPKKKLNEKHGVAIESIWLE